jgi:hypothetical protein
MWALRRVLIHTEQQVQRTGGRHDSIELVHTALRSGEIRGHGLCRGEQAMRWIAPAEWNRLRIEIEPNLIFELHGPPSPVVRRLDDGPKDPPAMTQVCLDAGQVQAWLIRIQPTLNAPKQCTAKPLPTKPAPGKRLPSKEWIMGEVERMRARGEKIPSTITEFSRELRRRMLAASKIDDRVRPLKTRTIENRLRDWELCPVKPANKL